MLSQSCAEERGIQPPAVKYVAVYASAEGRGTPFTRMVRVYDFDLDSIIAEFPYDGAYAFGLDVTSDGKYAAINESQIIRVFNLESGSLLKQMDHILPRSLRFICGDGLKLFVGSTEYFPSAVYDFATGLLDTVLPEVAPFGMYLPTRGEFVTVFDDDWKPAEWTGVIRRSCDSRTILDSFQFVSPATAANLRVDDAVLSPGSDAIYVMARDDVGKALFRYDLTDHSCTFRHTLRETRASFALSPDGREVWLIQHAPNFTLPTDLGYILVVDALTGLALDTIYTSGYWKDYPEAAFPLTGPIAFHPDGSRVYAGSEILQESLMVLDRKSRRVNDILVTGRIYGLEIAPR